MKKLDVIMRPDKLEDLKHLLNEKGIYGMTVYMVNGCGHQKGRNVNYKGCEISINLLPKVKIELVVTDKVAESIVPEIMKTVKIGEMGDGKIFIYDCIDAIRIRTGERGDDIL